MSDNRTKVTVEFDIADLAMIADALMIGRNTAMMCSSKVSENRLQKLYEMISALIPDAAKVFKEFDWTEICIALRGAETWDIEFRRSPYSGWNDNCGDIFVIIDGKEWKSDNRDITKDDGTLECVTEFLEEFSPLEAERVAKEEETRSYGM